MSNRKSTLQKIGIPEKFGSVLLTVTFIILLGPYFPGRKIGSLEIPNFTHDSLTLKILGPIIFLFSVFLFIPIWTVKGSNTIDHDGHKKTGKITSAHKRDFLAFLCSLFNSDYRLSNLRWISRFFSSNVEERFNQLNAKSLLEALEFCEYLGAVETSYDKALNGIRNIWHDLEPTYKEQLIHYLDKSPIGVEFEGMLFLTKDEINKINQIQNTKQ